MKVQDALQVFGLSGDVDFETAKTQYRRLCAKYHPDRNPAGHTMMQVINVAWDVLRTVLEQGSVQSDNANNAEYGDNLAEAINAIIGCAGLSIEVCGAWVWVSGDTRIHKDIIKGAGFKWAMKKKMWYYRPENYRSRSRGGMSMDDIRERHGSDSVSTVSRRTIATH